MANRFGLQIRAPTSADVAGIVELMLAGGVPASPQAVGPRLEALQLSANAAAFIAVEYGPPSGIVVTSRSCSLLADAGIAHIDMLLVAPDDRRRGIGRLLLKAAAQSARLAGCGEIVLASEQAELCAFCEATGFARVASTFARPLRKKS